MFEVKEGLDDRNKDLGDFFNLKMTMILKALVAIMAKVSLKSQKYIERKILVIA